ncbi:TIGR02453 family protein [Apibacter mensalis]|uniref:TIGR02453 family protein n=1 Tax=Apibacter mensalis TaxID=1586267 RepID=A0A0X8XY19_9FLAO|nr:DUF2461 domain-containing protein [Apibacter mensalis]CVK15629.1 TIGR02453 family protein [Apibacter mensalis]
MLQKDTIIFLSELKKNNNRDWFAKNKDWYENSHKDFEQLVSELIHSISQFDIQTRYLIPKKCIYRIYRDMRFSKDKTPYKTHFGAVISEKKGSGFYIHVEPGNTFLSCGYYGLTSHQLKNIRQGISKNYKEFRTLLSDSEFKKEIGDLSRGSNVLKRVPVGFDKENPAAEYLKLKEFYTVKPFDDEKLFNRNFIAYTTNIYKLMQPIYEFLEEFVHD